MDLSCFEPEKCTEHEILGGVCADCPLFFKGDGKNCSDTRKFCEDENPCFEGVNCTNLFNKGNFTFTQQKVTKCDECPEYFTGSGEDCTDTRTYCVDNPCTHQNATCVDSNFGAKCVCDFSTGFVTENYDCVDTRTHCDNISCFQNRCTETETGGVCSPCPEFFTGSGVDCFDTRIYCLNMTCFDQCKDTELGGSCLPCPDYFEGDGVFCQDTREHCNMNPCFPGVNCTEKAFGAECASCPEYFTGNGKNCIDTRIYCSSNHS